MPVHLTDALREAMEKAEREARAVYEWVGGGAQAASGARRGFLAALAASSVASREVEGPKVVQRDAEPSEAEVEIVARMTFEQTALPVHSWETIPDPGRDLWRYNARMTLIAARAALPREDEGLREDFRELGCAFAELHSQAINGVVCDPTADPGRHGCSSCLGAWKAGEKILDKHDEKWGNMFRSGRLFQPLAASPVASREVEGDEVPLCACGHPEGFHYEWGDRAPSRCRHDQCDCEGFSPSRESE